MEIIKSAAKISLLVVIIVLALMAGFTAIWGVMHGTLDPKDILSIFGGAVTMIVAFYFGKSISNNNSTPSDPDNTGSLG